MTGIFIGDSEYKRGMEGNGIAAVLRYFLGIDVNELPALLLADIQKVHDTVPPDYWYKLFLEIAEKFGLKPDVLLSSFTEYNRCMELKY